MHIFLKIFFRLFIIHEIDKSLVELQLSGIQANVKNVGVESGEKPVV